MPVRFMSAKSCSHTWSWIPAPSATSRIGTGASPPRRARSTSAATAAWLLSLTVITPGGLRAGPGTGGRLAKPLLVVVVVEEERRRGALAPEHRTVRLPAPHTALV